MKTATLPMRRPPQRAHHGFLKASGVEGLLQRGIDALKSNQWAEALESFKAFSQAKPQHPQVDYLAALAQYQLGQRGEATASLQRHLGRLPQDANAWGVLASIYFDQFQFLAAKHAYQQALAIKPQDTNLLVQYAQTLQQLDDGLGAQEIYQTLLKLNPKSVVAHHQLALLYQDTSQIEEALLHFQLAIALDDRSVSLHFDLGLLWSSQQYFQLAYLQFKRCLMLNPDHHPSHYNCGLIKHKEQLWSEAIEHFDQALSLQSPYPLCLIAKGQTLMAQKKWDVAQSIFQQVIDLDPHHIDAWLNLGLVYKAKKQIPLAQECFTRVLEQDPQNVLALNNLGLLCQGLGHFDLAAECFVQCQRLDPQYLAACVNLSATHEKMGNYPQAIRELEMGLECVRLQSPVAVETMTRLLMKGEGLPAQLLKGLPLEWAIGERNLGLLVLRDGDFQRGWPLYDYRFLCGEVNQKYTQTHNPRFNPSPASISTRGGLEGRSKRIQKLLIWAEQGVGDELMFGSLLAEALGWAEELLVQVDPRLLGLFKRAYPQITFIQRSLELGDREFDAHLPMGSLPRHLRPDWASFNAQPLSYLKVEDRRFQEVKERLALGITSGSSGSPRTIGISWRSQNETVGSQRSIELAQLVGKLQSLHPEGVRLINLQYGSVHAEIEDCFKLTGVRIQEISAIDNFQDLEGLACLIQACDEVVSVDNSTVHLAGALGQSVTALLPVNADWRWFEGMSQSVWYPSVRLLRQTALGDWQSCWSQH
jgi:tetratricopeptide (TPR) repeat protein